MTGADALVERLFREESGRIVAWLARLLGPQRLELVEDAVQDAFGAALGRWPIDGFPAKPGAWLATAARNKALDRLKQTRRLEPFEEGDAWRLGTADPEEGARLDDSLALMFIACDPALDHDEQIMLTLKTVSGFGVKEIARAYLATPEAVTQRLVRAKRKIRDLRLAFAIPEGPELDRRLPALLDAIYLLFNGGYTAGDGEALIRAELCAEALRLATLLTQHPTTATGEAHALAALIAFSHARAPARTGDGGSLVLLAEQDRGRWDRALIATGFDHLAKAMASPTLSCLHVEAGIASVHAAAASFAETDWPMLRRHYGMLKAMKPTPVVELNAAIAEAYVEGPARGLAALDALMGSRKLGHYALYHAARGDLLEKLGRAEEAACAFTMALGCPLNDVERAFLLRRAVAH